MARSQWTDLTDEQLLRQCEVDTYRASGPGGQKRNKTSSAVRLRHPPSGLIVIAEESRSQHENRARAFKRLRQALFVQIRDELHPDDLKPERLSQRPDYAIHDGRIDLGRKDPHFWPTVGLTLDVLAAVQARVSDAAQALGISTANLTDFLRTEPKVWQEANNIRTRFGQKLLR